MNKENSSKFDCTIDTIPPQYVLDLRGQKFIRFAGLQFLMDRIGSYRVQTTCVRHTTPEVVYEAKVWVIPSDEYLESKGITLTNPCISLLLEPIIMHASSNTENTSSNMTKFRDCLAETRAIARAFRIATGCPYTAVDELDRRDLVQKAEETGISVESLEDMINKEQMATIAKKTVPAGAMTRNDMIIHIKNAMKRHKGVNECVKKYLDDHNAMIVENLSDADIKDLHDKSVKLEGGA